MKKDAGNLVGIRSQIPLSAKLSYVGRIQGAKWFTNSFLTFLLKYSIHREKGTNYKCADQWILATLKHLYSQHPDQELEHYQHLERPLPCASSCLYLISPRATIILTPETYFFACFWNLCKWNHILGVILCNIFSLIRSILIVA